MISDFFLNLSNKDKSHISLVIQSTITKKISF